MTGVASFEDVVEAFMEANPSAAGVPSNSYVRYIDVIPTPALAHGDVDFPALSELGWEVQSTKSLAQMDRAKSGRGLRVFVGKQEGAAQDDSEESESVLQTEHVTPGDPLPCDREALLSTAPVVGAVRVAYMGESDE